MARPHFNLNKLSEKIVLFGLEKRIIGPFQGVISQLFSHISDTCHGPTPLPKNMREALWFELNPHLKDSAQITLSLCGLCLPRRWEHPTGVRG